MDGQASRHTQNEQFQTLQSYQNTGTIQTKRSYVSSAGGYDQILQRTMQFQKEVLSKVDEQDQDLVPLASTTNARSFKELANILVDQLFFLHDCGYIQSKRNDGHNLSTHQLENQQDLIDQITNERDYYQQLALSNNKMPTGTQQTTLYNESTRRTQIDMLSQQKNMEEQILTLKDQLIDSTTQLQQSADFIEQLNSKVNILEQQTADQQNELYMLRTSQPTERQHEPPSSSTSSNNNNLKVQAMMIEQLVQQNQQLQKSASTMSKQGNQKKTNKGYQSQTRSEKQLDNILTPETDSKFNQFVNLKHLDYIVSQFNAAKQSKDSEIMTKNVCFNDIVKLTEDLVYRLHRLFVQCHAQMGRIQTFEETMLKLDQVFSQASMNQVNGEQIDRSGSNIRVAENLRQLNDNCLRQNEELQEEINLLRSVEQLPHELVGILRRASAQHLVRFCQAGFGANNSVAIEADDDHSVMSNSAYQRPRSNTRNGSRKSNSKSIKKINISDPFTEFNSALDKNQELQGENELYILENNQLKKQLKQQEIFTAKLQQQLSNKEQSISLQDKDSQILENKINGYKQKIDEQTKAYDKLAAINEELRQLFQQEREAFEQEKINAQSEIEQIIENGEQRRNIIKNKLYVLYSTFNMGKKLNLDKQTTSIDEIIKALHEYATFSHQNEVPQFEKYKPQPCVLEQQNYDHRPQQTTVFSPEQNNNLRSQTPTRQPAPSSVEPQQLHKVNQPTSSQERDNGYNQSFYRTQQDYHHHASQKTDYYQHSQQQNTMDNYPLRNQAAELENIQREDSIHKMQKTSATLRNRSLSKEKQNAENYQQIQPVNITRYDDDQFNREKAVTQSIEPPTCYALRSRTGPQDLIASQHQQQVQPLDTQSSLKDILNNFNKEKAQFNEKLDQLRSKLSNIDNGTRGGDLQRAAEY